MSPEQPQLGNTRPRGALGSAACSTSPSLPSAFWGAWGTGLDSMASDLGAIPAPSSPAPGLPPGSYSKGLRHAPCLDELGASCLRVSSAS